ncbi:hypothetical protein J4403_03940 [Candidatus Woesearchaeota archaeon]|nr:hypothetical protein [Candidatus Woesearchaeota archaeon]
MEQQRSYPAPTKNCGTYATLFYGDFAFLTTYSGSVIFCTKSNTRIDENVEKILIDLDYIQKKAQASNNLENLPFLIDIVLSKTFLLSNLFPKTLK